MGRRLICLNCYFHVCMHDLGGRGVRNLELAVCRNEFQYKRKLLIWGSRAAQCLLHVQCSFFFFGKRLRSVDRTKREDRSLARARGRSFARREFCGPLAGVGPISLLCLLQPVTCPKPALLKNRS
jgi:hypothetical protein